MKDLFFSNTWSFPHSNSGGRGGDCVWLHNAGSYSHSWYKRQKAGYYGRFVGYYEFRLKKLKAGTYILFASANYKSKTLCSPQKNFSLKPELVEQFLAFLKELWHKFLVFLTSLALGPLWLVIPIIILIIILLLKICRRNLHSFIETD